MSEQIPKSSATPLLDEFVRQVGTQAALVAGFAFIILTTVSLEPSTPYNRGRAFVICASLTIGSELLAAFILGTLGFVVKINSSDQMEDMFQTEMNVAWGAYLIGLLSFLAALILLAWIKYQSIAIWVAGIVIIALALGMVVLANMVRKTINVQLEMLICGRHLTTHSTGARVAYFLSSTWP